MRRFNQYIVLAIFMLCLIGLVQSRANSHYNYTSHRVVFEQPVHNPLFLHGLAGPVPGMSADFKILNTFSVLDAINVSGKHEHGALMATYLLQASRLDPYFFDVYRLASSVLTYDAKMPYEAVELLDYGSLALNDNWEFPFLGGFIAHEQLHDEEKAFLLMSRVLDRPNAPNLAVNLATKYMRKTQTKADVLLFLRVLLQTMPEKYRAGVMKKIADIQGQAMDKTR
ncbi:MAG: hypothetical protein R8M45_08435 [Ghiorsea sp.]